MDRSDYMLDTVTGGVLQVELNQHRIKWHSSPSVPTPLQCLSTALHRSPPLSTAFTPLRLGMHRSDYMLDTVTGGVLQVELNTISSSFPGLTSRVTDLHRLAQVSGGEGKPGEAQEAHGGDVWGEGRHMVGMYGEKAGLSVDSVPLNTAAVDMADALAAAWREYGDER
ncbi:unnamed protein product [Closterium sp. NIES-65]|nr:unnamed protein product [Closterium sp. NIES-65]